MTTFNVFGSSLSPTPVSINRAAPGVGRRNIVTGISVNYTDTAAAIVSGGPVLRDGLSGVGTVVYNARLSTPAAGQTALLNLTFDPPLIMSENTQTTLEFGSIAGANQQQIVTLRGYVV